MHSMRGLLAAMGVAGWAVLAVGPSVWWLGRPPAPSDRRAEIATVRYEPGAITFLLTWLAGGLALYYIAVLDRNAFNVRYASFVTPALYTLLGVRAGGLCAAVAAAAHVLFVWSRPVSSTAYADIYDSRNDREHMAEVSSGCTPAPDPATSSLSTRNIRSASTTSPTRSMKRPLHRRSGSDTVPARYLFVDINTIDQRLSDGPAARRASFGCSGLRATPTRATAFSSCSTRPAVTTASRSSGLHYQLVGVDSAD